MAVVVQQMLFPQAAGILFTADPVTSNRKVVSIEASFGLGEALVAGRVNPDVYQVRDSEIVAKSVAAKLLAIRAQPSGGTRELAIDPADQQQPALTDAQIVELAALGRRIEAHFGHPQDIEWCLAGDGFQVVQSRPITTLFPIPAASSPGNRVYLSVGHQQMMTDAMKPLGLSLWLLTTPAPATVVGGRLFVDATQRLASLASRAALVQVVGKSDPLTGDALQAILDRGDFIPTLQNEGPGAAPADSPPAPIETDPAIVAGLIEHSQDSLATLKRDIEGKSGPPLLDFILADIQELRRILFDRRSHQVFMSAMEATWSLNEQLEGWLGEKNAVDVLTQSVPNIRNFEPGAGERRFEHGRRQAQEKEVELLTRLRALPDGERKADEANRMIDRIRTFIGYREYPKYHMISRYFVYKQALLAEADLEPGDILVTAYTDPSWTPAFVAIQGLVTEVGGLMTHGAVIAREYGLPAVVGVEQATRLIRDGQRVRVHGTDGYVELLERPI
jgi:phosphoenolpyruvate synthase/pyruvate phosphate dikinase